VVLVFLRKNSYSAPVKCNPGRSAADNSHFHFRSYSETFSGTPFDYSKNQNPTMCKTNSPEIPSKEATSGKQRIAELEREVADLRQKIQDDQEQFQQAIDLLGQRVEQLEEAIVEFEKGKFI
jgi:molecular chaperone GrpE (heat shock protein)